MFLDRLRSIWSTPAGARLDWGGRLHDAVLRASGASGATIAHKRLAREALAGIIASLITIAHCISFATLVFQGELRVGLTTGLWGLLLGTAIASVMLAATTSLPPALAGPRNPAIAVMMAMAVSVGGQVISAGGTGAQAATHVLVALSVATVLLGLTLALLGAFRLGQIVRFVPYPVVAGFLGAAGWLLIVGGIKLILGPDLSPARLLGLDAREMAKIGVVALLVIAIFTGRSLTRSVLVLPVGFFGGAMLLDLVLWASGAFVRESPWFVAGAGETRAWLPLAAVTSGAVDWAIIVRALPELGAIVGVTLITLLLDVTSLEVARAKVADLDREFSANAAANLVAAPLGGFAATLALNPARMLEEAGGRTRAAGILGGAFVGVVTLTGVDLLALVPSPILAGLVIYLGISVLQESILKAPAGRSWMELTLAVAIMLAIVWFGYLVGVILGVVGACLMFAFSYGRIGVVRRHLTRDAFSSNVERGPQASAVLMQEGKRIHVFWLTGFIFFGSSNGLFERVRQAIGTAAGHGASGDGASGPPDSGEDGARYVVLDCSGVTGFDTSAILTLVKLRNWADEHGVTLAYAGLPPRMQAAFEAAGLVGSTRRHCALAGRNEALEWCEEQVLAREFGIAAAKDGASRETPPDREAEFARWLTREIGPSADTLIAGYLVRNEIAAGALHYAQGGPSDSIDLVAVGSIVVNVHEADGRVTRVRRMAGNTVVGEMGFFRGQPRAAAVVADEAAVTYTLTRVAYDRLLTDDPALATRFLEFIVRMLSDRVAFANREIGALL